MPLYESPAIVLRSIRLGEADKIVTFFTRKFGKLKAVAKASLRPKSKFGGRLEPFVHCKMIAFGKEKADLLRLNSCDVINPFSAIRDNFDRMNRAFVSVEMVDICQREGDVNEEGFELLLSLWRAMSAEPEKEKQDLLLRLFELKYMTLIGYQPSLSRCVSCGGEIGPPQAGFNARKGGAVCRKCLDSDPAAFRVSAGAVKLMSRSLTTPVDKLARLVANPAMLEDISRCVTEFVRTHVRKEFKSERFLRL